MVVTRGSFLGKVRDSPVGFRGRQGTPSPVGCRGRQGTPSPAVCRGRQGTPRPVAPASCSSTSPPQGPGPCSGSAALYKPGKSDGYSGFLAHGRGAKSEGKGGKKITTNVPPILSHGAELLFLPRWTLPFPWYFPRSGRESPGMPTPAKALPEDRHNRGQGNPLGSKHNPPTAGFLHLCSPCGHGCRNTPNEEKMEPLFVLL